MRLSDNLFWRRLHSFTGALPLGVFLLFHLYENTYSHAGPAVYDAHVQSLRALPYLKVIEFTFIIIPLLFHSIYGLFIWYTGKNNYPQYAFVHNGLYAAQRLTGLVAFVFVFYHLKDQWLLPAPSYQTVKHSIGNPAVFVMYFLGITAVAFHFFNGLWSVLIKWGVTIGPVSRRITLACCGALSLGLVFVGLRALAGFMG